jgi:hypothetical protein
MVLYHEARYVQEKGQNVKEFGRGRKGGRNEARQRRKRFTKRKRKRGR